MPTPSLTHSQLTHYPFRFPDYDPASRHAPREMGILYQIFTRANGCSANLIWRVQRAIYARIRQTAPHLRIAHILAYMCLRLRRGATLPPAKRSVHYRGHPTGGPSRGALRLLRSSRYALTQPDAFGAGASRDGHSQLSHTLKRIGSAREKRMENDFLVNCSTPFLVASRSDATPCSAAGCPAPSMETRLPAALPPKRSCL